MRALLLLPLVLSLAGCNWFNHVTGLSKDSDKAVGAACRQTGRSLEECYLRNPDADRAQVFSGWREMHEYMVKQNLPTMAPPVIPVPASAPTNTPPAQKTSDNGQDGQAGLPPMSGGADSGKPDPEVQAVLDTINNRPNASGSAQPSPAEQQKLQQTLTDINKKRSSAPSKKKG